VFEGLFSPWHLIIIAGAVFLVLGPNKLAERWHGIARGVQQLTDGELHDATEEATAPQESEPEAGRRGSLAYRIGQRLRRRRQRR